MVDVFIAHLIAGIASDVTMIHHLSSTEQIKTFFLSAKWNEGKCKQDTNDAELQGRWLSNSSLLPQIINSNITTKF